MARVISEAKRAARRMAEFEKLGRDYAKAVKDGDKKSERGSNAQANAVFVEELYWRLLQGNVAVTRHRRRLVWSYLIYMAMAIALFVAGLVLLVIAVADAIKNGPDAKQALVGSLASVDLLLLLVLNPFRRMEQMMADFSQLLTILDDYAYQVGLRLVQMDIDDRADVGRTADRIQKATVHTTRMIEEFLEEREADPDVAALLGRLAAQPDAKVRNVLADVPISKRTLSRIPSLRSLGLARNA